MGPGPGQPSGGAPGWTARSVPAIVLRCPAGQRGERAAGPGARHAAVYEGGDSGAHMAAATQGQGPAAKRVGRVGSPKCPLCVPSAVAHLAGGGGWNVGSSPKKSGFNVHRTGVSEGTSTLGRQVTVSSITACSVAQSCPTLSDPMDCSLPGSSEMSAIVQ